MTRSLTAGKLPVALPGAGKSATSWVPHMLRKVTSLLHREEGSTAVEFAFLGPILAVGLLYLGLLSVSIHRNINIEQIVRVGVEAAVTDPGAQQVFARMAAAAAAKGYRTWSPFEDAPRPPESLSLVVARNCSCPENPNLVGACTTPCQDGRPMLVRYFLSAQQDVTDRDMRFFQGLAVLGAGPFIAETFIHKSVLVR